MGLAGSAFRAKRRSEAGSDSCAPSGGRAFGPDPTHIEPARTGTSAGENEHRAAPEGVGPVTREGALKSRDQSCCGGR